MKTTILAKITASLVVVASFTFSTSASAKSKIEDFNSMIEENAQVQKQLTADLQKQLKTSGLAKTTRPDFQKVGVAVLGHAAPENVAANTSGPKNKPIAGFKSPNLEKKNFKRLSQELRDVK